MRKFVTAAVISFVCPPAIAGQIFSGNWGNASTAPILIEIDDGEISEVCNFGTCGAIAYTIANGVYVFTNGTKRWTFERSREHAGYNAKYLEFSGGSWKALSGAKLMAE